MTVGDDRGRARARKVLAGAAVVGVVVAVLIGFRWKADRAYVGTTVDARLDWGMCLNSIGWTDPTNGVGWTAGHDIVVDGPYESEPARARPVPFDSGDGRRIYTTLHASIGTVHFDAYDRATFTSRAGGTLQLTRVPSGGMVVTADCVGGADGSGVDQPRTTLLAWAEVNGVLGTKVPGTDEVELVTGTIEIELDGVVVESVRASGRGPFSVSVPQGTVTVRGSDAAGRTCGEATFTLVAGDHVSTDFLCPTP